ncbi:thioredoxin-dependent thiol peroxidase [Helicobacter sp. MIT 14-3879]|uniref:thioredoxin-dependent thiol peroxidase n=1 Tax=Helicobacter sp. MIT 14-3879 TaxID=2040649 RepID=UPI000E1F7D5E|nr:thioredoxin-dependent thiol peroxidase [Helicobacter sp. MIT 14-3879]RDU64696.1 thioredoxin-dependent thiol peroxidase [Helicobacter sp. MIT 14-3879]
MKLEANQQSPKFSAKNENNKQVSLDDFKDKFVILYFYPKDMTKGCSIEANDFTSLLDEFNKLNAVIIGVSPDSVESHQKFIKKDNLKHTLLSDSDNTISSAFGAYGKKNMYGREYMGIIRSTFIIKNNIILEAFYNVKATNHAKKVLESLKKHI